MGVYPVRYCDILHSRHIAAVVHCFGALSLLVNENVSFPRNKYDCPYSFTLNHSKTPIVFTLQNERLACCPQSPLGYHVSLRRNDYM